MLAIDLGGSRIKAAIVHGGDVGAVAVRDAPPDLDGALAAMRDIAADLAPSGEIDAIGLAVPGLVGDDGRIQSLPGKYDGIEGFDLPGFLRRELGGPAVVVNDAVAYGVGEAIAGAGRGADRVLVVTIGTGVGVTVVDHGRPVTSGPFGGGIMGGNVPISDEDGVDLDTSGRSGTIEARCRAVRIVDYANRAGGAYADVPAVYAGDSAGEPAARAGLDEYRRWLARGLAALASAHGVARVVVGGGPVTDTAPILDGVAAGVQSRMWPSHELDVVRATLGDSAALVGLAQLAPPR